MRPDYKRIYSDIINKKFPGKMEECKILLDKKELSVIDILELDQKIFGKMDKSQRAFNQKIRSYKLPDIREILDYQNKYQLNNSQLANHFQLSRNTIAKWKKMIL